MDNIFSKFQCSFRKSYSTQQCLLSLIEKWKSAVDKGKSFGTLLPLVWFVEGIWLYTSQIYDSFITNGFSLNVLRLIHSYLSNRRQRTKVNESYSSWGETLFGVPLGSMLGPLLFNVFICDLFFIVNKMDLASYADDNTSFVSSARLDKVLNSLENALSKLLDWFSKN